MDSLINANKTAATIHATMILKLIDNNFDSFLSFEISIYVSFFVILLTHPDASYWHKHGRADTKELA